jgi:DNA-binding transcriptional MerR regulator
MENQTMRPSSSLRDVARTSTFAIGQAARRAKLTPRAIRFYEQRGLITTRRDAAGVRIYGEAELERLSFIAAARRYGISVKEIDELIRLGQTHGAKARAERMLELCRERIQVLDAQRQAFHEIIETLSREAGEAASASPRLCA